MSNKHKSEDHKINAVQYYLSDKNISQLEVCNIFKCSPRSLMRWVKRYNEENGIKRHNKKSMSYKVKKEHVKFILNEIKKNKTITMAEIKEKINDVFNISLSRYHINRIVKDNNYTLKITKIRPLY